MLAPEPHSASGQAERIADQNAAFFADNTNYADRVERLVTYRNIRHAIDREIDGASRMLDIGNGGVFDYDVDLVRELVAVDLFLDDQAPNTPLPSHVTLRHGDALALSERDDDFDAVLLALVFHHLTGETPDALLANVRTALSEAHRTLKPGGRLIVLESCVPRWFYRVERLLFGTLMTLSRTPLLGGHPATLQLPADMLAALIAEQFGPPRIEAIPMGRWVMQFGRRWPSRLTPATPWLLVATR